MLIDCRIDKPEMLSYLGGSEAMLDDSMQEEIDSAIRACEASCKPSGIAKRFRISRRDENTFKLDGCSLSLEGSDVAKRLDGAASVVLMVVTLGLNSEQWLRRERLKPLSRSLISDAAASALTEAGVNELERILSSELHDEGMLLGERFSPGYGSVPLEAQRPLLDALDAERSLGIHLNDDMLMVPTKSITAIAGIFEAQDERKGSSEPVSWDIPEECSRCLNKRRCSHLSKGRTCRDL